MCETPLQVLHIEYDCGKKPENARTTKNGEVTLLHLQLIELDIAFYLEKCYEANIIGSYFSSSLRKLQICWCPETFEHLELKLIALASLCRFSAARK